jgi:hypothetical protein
MRCCSRGCDTEVDSPFYKYATGTGWDFPTQASKASEALATSGNDRIFPVVEFGLWELEDKPAERANFGLITDLDNAYDGREGVVEIGADSWGYKTGGEASNYGNYVDLVQSANLSAFRSVSGP